MGLACYRSRAPLRTDRRKEMTAAVRPSATSCSAVRYPNSAMGTCRYQCYIVRGSGSMPAASRSTARVVGIRLKMVL
jgi:hypothetical protein